MEALAKRQTKDQVSFLSGNRYIFSYQYNRIELWTSSFTGKEVVKVNGQVVSQASSYRKSSQHCFNVGGQALMVEIKIQKILKGPAYCVLYERDSADNWQPVAAKKLVVWPAEDELASENEKPRKTWRSRLSWWLPCIFFFGLGVFLSRTVGFNTWQFWVIVFVFVGIVTPLDHYFKRRRSPTSHKSGQSLGIYIEDISVEQLHAET